MEEQWKDVLGFPDYKVSDLGNFIFKEKTKIGKGGCEIFLKERSLIKTKNIHNHIHMHLINGKIKKNTSLHRIVFETFKHEIPKGMIINHINGIKNDCRLINLECITQSENIIHAYKTGLYYKKYVKI